MESFKSLSRHTTAIVIKDGIAKYPLDYIYAKGVQVENEVAFYNGANFTNLRKANNRESCTVKYDFNDEGIQFGYSAHARIEGKICYLDYMRMFLDKNGELLVNELYSEAIFCWISRQLAYEQWKFTQKGAEMYKEMDRQWEKARDRAISEIEFIDEDEMEELAYIWDTKVPLNITRQKLKNFNR